MKKLICSLLPLLLLILVSCRGAMISDGPITVNKQVKMPPNHRYKYFYKCKQEGYKTRVYSNSEYKEGQIIKIK